MKEEQQTNVKKMFSYLSINFLILIIGVVAGLYIGNLFHQQKLDEAIKLQRFLYKSIVYTIAPNVEISK